MVILTVRFPHNDKEYDYLMVNPQKIKIDKEKPLQLVTGISYKGVCTKPIYVIRGEKIDFLPEHVTAKIILDNNNLVRIEQLNSGEIQYLKTRSTSTLNNSKDNRSKIERFERYLVLKIKKICSIILYHTNKGGKKI